MLDEQPIFKEAVPSISIVDINDLHFSQLSIGSSSLSSSESNDSKTHLLSDSENQ